MLNFMVFGSHDRYIFLANNLAKIIKQLNIFNNTIIYTANNLKSDTTFWNMHKTFIENNKRGYGYWIWKPYLIYKTMQTMNDGDILLYLDCDIKIEPSEKQYLLDCINAVKKDKIIGTFTKIEKDWTKMDLIHKLNMNKEEYLNSPQHQSGIILFLVCNETRKLVSEWYRLCCDYHNVNDSKSIHPNIQTFREHRHDQSIFSLLTKRDNLYSKINLRTKFIIQNNIHRTLGI